MNSDILIAFIKIIVLLPLVTALAYFLIKYGLARQSMNVGGMRRMRVVEQISLGPKTFVSMIEIGGRYIMLAHSESGFQVIQELEELPDPLPQQDLGITSLKAAYRNFKVTSGENPLLSKIFFRKGKER